MAPYDEDACVGQIMTLCFRPQLLPYAWKTMGMVIPEYASLNTNWATFYCMVL